MTKLKHIKLFENFGANDTPVNGNKIKFLIKTLEELYYGTVSSEDYDAIISAIDKYKERSEEDDDYYEIYVDTFGADSFSMDSNGEFEGFDSPQPEDYDTFYNADGEVTEGERRDELNVIMFEFPEQGVLEYIGGTGVIVSNVESVISNINSIGSDFDDEDQLREVTEGGFFQYSYKIGMPGQLNPTGNTYIPGDLFPSVYKRLPKNYTDIQKMLGEAEGERILSDYMKSEIKKSPCLPQAKYENYKRYNTYNNTHYIKGIEKISKETIENCKLIQLYMLIYYKDLTPFE